MSLPECCICLDEIKKNPLTCPHCKNTAHIACTKTHLLNEQQEPICFHPDCTKYWSREVIDAMPLPKSWVGKELREHRANVLYERERAMFPATAERVATRSNLDYLKTEIDRLRTLLEASQDNEWFAEAVQERNAVTREHADECIRLSEACGLRERIKFLTTCLRSMEVGQKVVEGRDNSPATERTIASHERNYNFRLGANASTKAAKKEATDEEKKPKVLFGCPADGCNGFVSSYNVKCLICECLACRECRELICKTANVKPEDVRAAVEGHACDEGTLATLALVASDSKKCPSCRVDIMRTEGCPVMLCTHCGTFFDWNTMKRLQGKPHNPHYEEYLRMKNGGAGSSSVESRRNECVGQIPTKDAFILRIKTLGLPLQCSLQLGATGVRILDLVRHIQNREIVAEPDPQAVNLNHRLAFLRNEKTEERFKQLVQQNDKKLSLQRERNQVWEMFCAEVAVGMQTNIMNRETANKARAVEFLTSLTGLIAYVNKAMTAIGKRYNHQPFLIIRSHGEQHVIHNAIRSTFTYEVKKQLESNLDEPSPVVHLDVEEDKAVFPNAAMTFIGALKSLITPLAEPVPSTMSHDELFNQPRKRKSSSSDSD